MVPDVTVVIPLYGEHRSRVSVATVAAAWFAQDVSCEVVLVTAGDIALGDIGGARVLRADRSLRAPGLLRNVGVAAARGRLLYLSDADVAPLGRNYLSRALTAAGGGGWAQPWMHRLVGPVPEAVVDLTPALAPVRYCFVIPGDDGILRPYPGEVIVWKRMQHCGFVTEVPTMHPPPELVSEPTDKRVWRAPFHWGGMLLTRRLFDEVGGYCRRYFGWGCEDDDLYLKVAFRATVGLSWTVGTSPCCLHFEHPYPYSGTPERKANSALYTQRLALGPAEMINQDLAEADTHG
jgi:hypothetical protein